MNNMSSKSIEKSKQAFKRIDEKSNETVSIGKKYILDKKEFEQQYRSIESSDIPETDKINAINKLKESFETHRTAYQQNVTEEYKHIISDRKEEISSLDKTLDSLLKTTQQLVSTRFVTKTGNVSNIIESTTKATTSANDTIKEETEKLESFMLEVLQEEEQMQSPDWDRTMLTPDEEAFIKELEETGEIYIPTQREMPEPKPESMHLPSITTGLFLGDRGNSEFVPISQRALETMQQYGRCSVEYKNGYPDFSPFTEHETDWGKMKCIVEIPNMTQHRTNPKLESGARRPRGAGHDPIFEIGNYAQADNALAMKFKDMGITGGDIEKYRTKNKLVWHECPDTATMMLVSQTIHEACPHSGGVSQKKYINQLADIERLV